MDNPDALLEELTGFQPKQSAPLETAENRAGGIQRVHYHHDAMIDLIIANPTLSQGEIAAHFNMTEPWISRVINSDSFQARLAERKKDLVDPGILQSVNERMNVMVHKSLEIIQDKLEKSRSVDVAFKAAELATKALGFGARNPNVVVQNSFVVALPEKAPNQDAWADRYAAAPAGLKQLANGT